MLRTDRTPTLEDDPVAEPLFETLKPARQSMLYQMLPSMVSSRLPTLPSLRQSLNDVRNGSAHNRAGSSSDLSEPETPPPSYTSQPGSGSVTPNEFSRAFAVADFDISDDASEGSSSSGSSTPSRPVYESGTGINWKYASQGRNLITQAHRESNTPFQDANDMSTSLTRQLYVHGLTYLLRGLPADLTPEETLSLHAALPADLATTETQADGYAMVPGSQRNRITQTSRPRDPTVLHRITASIVFHTFVFAQFLLPYVRLFMAEAYRFERKHQIANRIVNTGVTTVDEISRGGLRLSQTICQMNDGKVGQVINEMAMWCVVGVTGGVQQGFEEGLCVVGKGHEGSRRKRGVGVRK